MTLEGPSLDRLVHRLGETPGEFLKEPRQGKRGEVRVDAVVADLITALGGEPPPSAELKRFTARGAKQRNRLRAVLVACWLLHDEWFVDAQRFGEQALQCLDQGLNELVRLVSADALVSEPERREELARLCILALGLRPAGESGDQAADRLKTISSVEREKVVQAAKARERRARELREAMERKRAAEAAANYNHM